VQKWGGGAPCRLRERVPSGLSWQMRHPSLTITVLSVKCQMSDVLSVSREGSLTDLDHATFLRLHLGRCNLKE